MVPPASHRVSRVRRYSGTAWQGAWFRVRGSNPVPPAFPCRSATTLFSHCTIGGPTTPAGLALPPVWPLPRSLATTGGISVDFSSSGYLDVSVPRVASTRPMRSGAGGGAWTPPGFPIRRPTGHRACAPHRGLSQLATSFFGFQCQGIHRVPFPSSDFDGQVSHISNCDQMRSSIDSKNLACAMRLSRYVGGASPRDRTLRLRLVARQVVKRNRRAALVIKLVAFLVSLFSLERR